MKWETLWKYPGLLLKGVSETIQNEEKEQKGRFLSISLGRLGPSLLGNILTGEGVNRAGEGKIRDGYRSRFEKVFISASSFN